MRIATTLMIALILSTVSLGQTLQECVFHFEVDDPIAFADALSKSQPHTTQSRELPIVFHQFSNYNSGQIINLVNFLNQSFEQAGFPHTFAMCDFIEHDTLINTNGPLTISEVWEQHGIPNVINIFIFTEVGSSGATALFSSGEERWIALSRFDPTTVVHEMGHFMSLLHTHTSFYGHEFVDGSNCASAGDRFCDTPADPNLSGEVNNGCEYTGTEVDENGDFYLPDPTNFMSYTPPHCRSSFSPEQVAQMLDVVEALYADYACGTTSAADIQSQQLKIFPNPASEYFELRHEISDQILRVTISGISGEAVMIIDQPQSTSIDIGDLSAGCYIVTLTTPTYSLANKLVIN